MPSPTGFVVKNGSKIRFLTASSMPRPVSRTAMAAYGPTAMPKSVASEASRVRRPVVRVSVPRPSIASAPLMHRFTIAWPSCAGSASITRSAPPPRRSSVTRFASMRASSGSTSAITPSRATMPLRYWPRRENARSPRVRSAARVASRAMACRSARTPGSVVSSAAISAMPRMPAMMLFMSWASPAASVPTASIRCACTN